MWIQVTETCETCKFRYEIVTQAGSKWNECRRYPPQIGPTGDTNYSVITIRDWCGEYKENE